MSTPKQNRKRHPPLKALENYRPAVIDECKKEIYFILIIEGVMKTLMNCWFNSSSNCKPYYLRPYITKIDVDLLAIKPPHELSRRPRSLETSLKFWKASEYRSFLLFYAIPILKLCNLNMYIICHY